MKPPDQQVKAYTNKGIVKGQIKNGVLILDQAISEIKSVGVTFNKNGNQSRSKKVFK